MAGVDSYLTKTKVKKGKSPDEVLKKAKWPANTHMKILTKPYNSQFLVALIRSGQATLKTVSPQIKLDKPATLAYPSMTRADQKVLWQLYNELVRAAAQAQKQLKVIDAEFKKLKSARQKINRNIDKIRAQLKTHEALLKRMEDTCKSAEKTCGIQAPAKDRTYKSLFRLNDRIMKAYDSLDQFDDSEKGKLLDAYKSVRRDLEKDVAENMKGARIMLDMHMDLGQLLP